jgi:hypothetical protein
LITDKGRYLEGELDTSTRGDGRLDTGGGGKGEAVWDGLETSSSSGVSGAARAEVVTAGDSISTIGTVESLGACASPDVILNK